METQNTPNIAQNTGVSTVSHSVPTSHELLAYQTYAKTAVDSQMYRGVGKEAGVMMIMLAAREYGIGPAQALNGGLNIIEGKVELSARVMGAMIRRAGHTMKILESTDDRCRIYGRRCDTGEEYTAEFTIEQAQRAGLVKEKGAWKRTPDDMLFARTQSKLARRLFSDVIGIGYVAGEISTEETLDPKESIIELQVDKTMDRFEELTKNMDDSDKTLLSEYINSLAETYGWSVSVAIEKFMGNQDVAMDRFNEWKLKK